MILSTIFSVVISLPLSSNLNLFCFLGSAYGSEPSSQGIIGVCPWHTIETLKCSIRSLVTAYGAPITTSLTYCKCKKERYIKSYNIKSSCRHNMLLLFQKKQAWFIKLSYWRKCVIETANIMSYIYILRKSTCYTSLYFSMLWLIC